MPKKIIILDKFHQTAAFYRYVLWADVPAENQIAYRNPACVSRYENATPAELQSISDGSVAEKYGEYLADSASMATVQTELQARHASWQAEVNAVVNWADYGRNWDGTIWTATGGVPMIAAKETQEGLPSFVALTPVSAYGVNKFHFVLFNSGAIATCGPAVVKVRLVAILPGTAVVTGAAPSAWTLRRRQNPTTNPLLGTIAVSRLDSAQTLPSIITCHAPPTTPPAGGTVDIINEFVPQADELKLSTADAATLGASLSNWGGQVIYNSNDVRPARPLVVRAGECLEVQQSATAGTGNCRVLCLFTVG